MVEYGQGCDFFMKRSSFFRFSLLEVIISVTAVIIAGIFIVNIFVASATANKTAHNIDMAVSLAISATENFKAGTTPDSVTFYDEEWNRLIKIPEENGFALYADIAKNDDSEFYSIHVRVVEIHGGIPDKDKPLLVDYSAAEFRHKALETGGGEE